jgi:hypothetical protein
MKSFGVVPAIDRVSSTLEPARLGQAGQQAMGPHGAARALLGGALHALPVADDWWRLGVVWWPPAMLHRGEWAQLRWWGGLIRGRKKMIPFSLLYILFVENELTCGT